MTPESNPYRPMDGNWWAERRLQGQNAVSNMNAMPFVMNPATMTGMGASQAGGSPMFKQQAPTGQGGGMDAGLLTQMLNDPAMLQQLLSSMGGGGGLLNSSSGDGRL